ncbi:MAG: class I SAM-dependent methyltransferase [Rhodovibrionaceae bacterium]|nr:class I SAM-dependent methyltransferase [Rhodovibrionaceae bacterium]
MSQAAPVAGDNPESPDRPSLLVTPEWEDYALVDSGEGWKLERFGPVLLKRPEPQALWHAGAPERWSDADAVFQPDEGEEKGGWEMADDIASRWTMAYRGVRFHAELTSFRHTGVFPEQAVHWDWCDSLIKGADRPVKVLNLFGYTGLASLLAARAGAEVTHIDASRKAVGWARENQALSGLDDKPIRWICEDAVKFVEREVRRGNSYDGIILDPPKYGRGPKNEVWRFFESTPRLLAGLSQLLSDDALFLVMTAYAIRMSCLSIRHALVPVVRGRGGWLDYGEMVTRESAAGRLLPQAIYARWQA